MNNIHLRKYDPSDKEVLDAIRRQYWAADLEVPKGYQGRGHDTIIAEKDGQGILALTVSHAIILDPLIAFPSASPLEIQKALIKVEAAGTYIGQTAGAIDSYIAIPRTLTDYHRIVRHTGYEDTVQNCVVFRRPLLPDTEPLIGTTRDAVEALRANLKE